MRNNLTFSDGFSTSFKLATNQFFPVLGAFILWLLTIWIPYINVGTTIGLVRLQIKLGRKESIRPTDIFDAENRAIMGNIFLLWSFMTTGIVIGFVFFVIPGIVLLYAWILSSMVLLDKKLSPIDSITKSYELTYGHKWTIFFIIFMISLIVIFVQFFLGLLLGFVQTMVFDSFALEYFYIILLFMRFFFLFVVSIIPSLIQAVWFAAAYGYIYSILSDSK